MTTLSWSQFVYYAEEFLRVSKLIQDDWSIEGNRENMGGLLLKKMKFSIDERLRWEYTICYSPSYCMPVLYFNVWNSNGCILRLEEVWKYCNKVYKSESIYEMYSLVTQQEHPVLKRPYFMIHPCKTHEFVDEPRIGNPLVKFISTVAPLVNLTVDYRYGKIVYNGED